MISANHRDVYDNNGYVVVEGLFSKEECSAYIDHYMQLRALGAYPGDSVGVNPASDDPLLRYPRMIHMHHWDETSLKWLLDPRFDEALTALLGASPLAVQTMLYFKPPGARGQALHQDNFYLRVQPGTCMAAWLALDDCDQDNGCMQVVPGSQKWPILCPQQADTGQSFTDVTVALPPGAAPVPVEMKAGDVLFFNGSIVHGSFPNRSADRFRRALIAHYIEGNSEMVVGFYGKVVRMDGSSVSIATAPEGGPCGVWVNRDGETVPEIVADGLRKAAMVE
ncbi:MAG: phytanoyl-CoA dioxygenase family protein [Candidatus Sumerlaeaceae bacterium]